MKYFNITLLAFVFACASLFSEIEQIIINWQRGCDEACSNLLEKNFKKINQVTELSMNPSTNSARMNWKNDEEFTFRPFVNATSMVGVHIDMARVKVKGKIEKSGKDFWLVSTGDNTRFRLLGPWQQKPGQFAPMHSSAYRVLTEGQVDKLSKIEKDGTEVTLEGPLYLPYRVPPYELVLQN